MATQTAICNMALGHVKSDSSISSIDEESKEASKCKLFYTQALEETLEAFNWHFARVQATLPTTGDAPKGWIYQYTYPADCIAVRKIVPPFKDAPPIPFDIAHSAVSDSLVILTDAEGAVVEYTKLVTNTVLFSSLFTTAFAYRLANYIAIPLTGKRDLRNDMDIAFIKAISAARASSLNQSQPIEEPNASWITGRN